jgi:hypothetical protein
MSISNVRLWILVVVVVASTNPGAAQGAQSEHRDTQSDVLSAPEAEKRYPMFQIDGLVGASHDASLIGREIAVQNVRVQSVGNHGFWVGTERGLGLVFVVPAEGSLIAVRAGEVVSLHGEVRSGASKRHQTGVDPKRGSLTPYVYAYTVRPAW